MHVKILDA